MPREKEKPLSEVIHERRSTPSFAATPVDAADLQQILTAGLEAPSGYNLQPWRFIVVRDAEQRKALRAASHGQAKVEEAPVVIVACGDPEGWREGDLEEMLRLGHERGYDPERAERTRKVVTGYLAEHKNIAVWLNRQVMIATTTMMLMAEVLGYDTALMEGFEAAKVKQVLGLPDRMEIVCLLAIGHRRGEDKPHGGRFAEARLLSGDRYGNPLKS